MKYTVLIIAALLFSAVSAAAQKAEAKPIRFAKGASTASVSGTLSNDQEIDYEFSARAGQTVTLRVTSKPKGILFDFRVAGSIFELETDYDSYSDLSFTVPETGKYLIFVRKRPTESVKRARFTLALSIK